ncbi:probable GPI-anchored adhesin-like protein PGA55 [Amphibalanus amphitrite]|uniref:probable GPI-anchored adhesin-like protein PGA55 n=1 Tax=Amphibalanus amphitrite TaxID=1232801 RepID=UPI001C91CFD0|nr:probable GPI-anchored adhesin-like protein PGA55 [Amphibalanus amphitrite]
MRALAILVICVLGSVTATPIRDVTTIFRARKELAASCEATGPSESDPCVFCKCFSGKGCVAVSARCDWDRNQEKYESEGCRAEFTPGVCCPSVVCGEGEVKDASVTAGVATGLGDVEEGSSAVEAATPELKEDEGERGGQDTVSEVMTETLSTTEVSAITPEPPVTTKEPASTSEVVKTTTESPATTEEPATTTEVQATSEAPVTTTEPSNTTESTTEPKSIALTPAPVVDHTGSEAVDSPSQSTFSSVEVTSETAKSDLVGSAISVQLSQTAEEDKVSTNAPEENASDGTVKPGDKQNIELKEDILDEVEGSGGSDDLTSPGVETASSIPTVLSGQDTDSLTQPIADSARFGENEVALVEFEASDDGAASSELHAESDPMESDNVFPVSEESDGSGLGLELNDEQDTFVVLSGSEV